MTDPRLAALAEALEVSGYPRGITARDMAAAILAALPADWCGHSDDAERTALYLHTMDNMNATIARLRLALADCIQPCHECGAADIARTALDRADWCGHAIDPVEGVCLVCGEA